jgi:hypothetical protein
MAGRSARYRHLTVTATRAELARAAVFEGHAVFAEDSFF